MRALAFVVCLFSLACFARADFGRVFIDLSGPFAEPPPLSEQTPHWAGVPIDTLHVLPGHYFRITVGIEFDFRASRTHWNIMNVFLDFRDDSPDGSLEELLSVHPYNPNDVRGNARFHSDVDRLDQFRYAAAAGRLSANSTSPWNTGFPVATENGAAFKIGFTGMPFHQPPTFIGHFLVRVSPDAPEYEAITISTTRLSPIGSPGVTLRTCMVNQYSSYYFHDQGVVEYGGGNVVPEPASLTALATGLMLAVLRNRRMLRKRRL